MGSPPPRSTSTLLLTGALLAGALLAGALGGAAIVLWFSPAPRPGLAQTSTTAPDRMRRIHERLDTLEDELRDLRGRSEVRTASGSTPPAEKTTAAGSENPVRLRNLDDQQLLVETRRLRRKAKDPAGARRALAELLQRSLSPAERAEVFTELGSLERQAGRLQESEAQLHRALSHADPDGDSRAWAGYELALTLTKRGRHPDALAAANDAVAIKGSSKWVRAHCRWAVGTISEKVGNLDSARREYRELLTLIGDDTTFQWCIDDIRARLAAMR